MSTGSSPELRIRLALPGEEAAVDDLVAAAYTHDYGPSDGHDDDPARQARVRAAEHDVWVAVRADGALVGTITTRRPGGPALHEDVREDELDIRLLAVDPGARRQGIAGSLIGHVLDHARSHGYAAVFLKTMPTMTGPQRLYAGLGFARAPQRDGLWIDGRKVIDLYTYLYPL